jgi:Spy/CpxP family protein refolding chaperone
LSVRNGGALGPLSENALAIRSATAKGARGWYEREDSAAMKRQLCGFVLIGLLATEILFAQQPGTTPELRSPLPAAPQMSDLSARPLSKKSEKRLAHMSKRYRLTPEQQAQVRSILLKEEQDTQTVAAARFMSNGNKREEAVGLHDASQEKIGAILTDRQRHKFDADEKRRAWMDGRLPNPGPALNGGW